MSQRNSHTPRRPRTGERTLVACVACKQRKLKCNGRSPKCQNCTRTGRECVVEDPATGLHRPRDYIQSLESRVVYLENLLHQIDPQTASDSLSINGRLGGANAQSLVLNTPAANRSPENVNQAVQLAQSKPTSDNVHRSPSEEGEDDSVDRLSSEVALLCLNASGREPHYFGPSSAVSFSRIVSATMGLSAGRESLSLSQGTAASIGNLESDFWPESTRDPLLLFPSLSLGIALSEAYFNNIHPQYPFLHRPSFRIWEEECQMAVTSGRLENSNNIALFFVLMVYAIGSLALGQSQQRTAELYYSMALDRITAILDLNSLLSIQGILCCAVYSIRSPVGVSLWKISGMAIRHCIELGYHRSAEKFRGNVDILTREMSKRCFWVSYDIDRVAAFVLGRPFGIPEEAIDVELPADTDDENITPNGFLQPVRSSPIEPPTLMTGALHVIKLRQLWAKISSNIYLSTSRRQHDDNGTPNITIKMLRQELEEWHNFIPSHLDYSHSHPLTVFATSDWFEMAYDHSIVLLYRHYITSSDGEHFQDHHSQNGNHITSQDDEELEGIFMDCFFRSADICVRYRRLYQSPSIQLTWGSLHKLFLGGLTYLFCLWKSKQVRQIARQREVVSTCMACNTVLTIIAERWNAAAPYRDIFETISERTMGMMCRSRMADELTSGAADTTSPVSPGQEWTMALGNMDVPQEADWFVQELLNGFQQSAIGDLT